MTDEDRIRMNRPVQKATMKQSDRHLFSSRPAETRPCRSCGGLGRTTDPHWLVHCEVEVEGGAGAAVPGDAVHASVVGSASIFEATREAGEIARRSARPVAFEFNDVVVVVHPQSDPDLIARAWWLERHGETPEQTAARR